MASNDRTPRRRSPQPPATADEVYYEDDVFYGGDWREEEIYEDEVVDYRTPAPTRSGTAAGIDRLRQSLGRTGGNAAQPSGNSPHQATGRQPKPAPDYENEARSTLRRQSTDRSPTTTSSRPQPGKPARRSIERVDEPEDTAPYLEYEDDFTEYDAPRRQRPPRQRAQVSVPSIRRPTMPSAIANADLVSDVPALALIGGSILSLLGMSILVGNQVGSLAPEFATHVSASGVLEDFRSETALWRLPLLAAAFTLMNIVIAWFTSPIDRFASRFVLAAALVVQFIAWVAVIRIL